MRSLRLLLGSLSVVLALFLAPNQSWGQLRVVTPSSPQPITNIRFSPEVQKILEKPRGANPPNLRIEGYVDSRGTMTVGLRDEGLQQGTCGNCVSGHVQEWTPESQGISHFINPKGLRLSPVNPVNLLCKQDDRPGRFSCELR